MSVGEPLSIRALEAFVALVDHGSFTAAAQALGLGQSTVSGHIADLERKLGLRIVERERSGVVPTDAGRVLLVPVREALRAEQHARQAAQELVGLLRGRLRLGASTIPAAYLLPPRLGAFRERHPEIEIAVETGASGEVLARLASGEIDVAWVGRPPGEREGFEAVRLGGDRLVLVVAPTHPFAASPRIELARLAESSWVVRESGSGTQAAVDKALQAAGAPQPLPIGCRVGSTEAVKAMVRAGLGAAFVSDAAIQAEAATGELATIEVVGFAVERAFWVVARPAERMSPAGRAFWESLDPARRSPARRR